MKKGKIECQNRKTVFCDLKNFCMLAKEHSFIEVTEWTNGEGWDIATDDKHFSLTFGELEAINYLTKHLELNEVDKKQF